ncbi:TetR family transcriptional regulator [Clostridia bacterium]|nr:TetR family transcriptional regulator [Clostridia bacterium]
MRVIKEAAERKNEILDAAESLFIAKGYENTTINDILSATDIAKGTFYYHFKSKTEVLDGMIKRRGDRNIDAAKAIVGTDKMNAAEKLLSIMFAQKPGNEHQEQLIAVLENAENSRMFVKSLTDILDRLAPIVGDVVTQGVTEGLFSTPFPRESAEILLAAAHSLFDNPDLRWTQDEMREKIAAFLTAAERIIGTAPGTFSAMTQLFGTER